MRKPPCAWGFYFHESDFFKADLTSSVLRVGSSCHIPERSLLCTDNEVPHHCGCGGIHRPVEGEDGSGGKALPLAVKVKAFGTNLKKNKQTGSCLRLPNSLLQIRRVVSEVVKLVACSRSCLKGFLASEPAEVKKLARKTSCCFTCPSTNLPHACRVVDRAGARCSALVGLYLLEEGWGASAFAPSPSFCISPGHA